MPRDLAGNYTLPAGNPVVNLTPITPAWGNTTLNDIATQLNGVVTRDGLLGPTAPMAFPGGNVTTPSITFLGDLNTGWYSSAADQVALTLGGVQRVNYAPSGVNQQINQPANQIGLRISSDAGGPFFVLRDRSINAAPHTIGAIAFDAYRDVSDPSYVASIRCEGTSPAGNTGDLVFSTGGNAGTSLPPDRVRISSVGGVTISAPAAGSSQSPLNLSLGENGPPILQLNTTSTAISVYAQFLRSGASDGLLGSAGGAGALVSDAAAGDVVLRGDTRNIRFSTDGGGSSALVLTVNKRVYGTGLHNNGDVSGATNQYLASGTFTPTMFPGLNVTAATGLKCQWIRVGNVVTVSGECQIQTPGIAVTTCGMELPIFSNLAVSNDCSGVIQQRIGAAVAGLLVIGGDTVNNRANIQFTAVAASTNNYGFQYTYEVLA